MAIDRKQVESIIEAVGGKENIEAATHCVTRLRFALADESKIDERMLEQNDLVKGHFSTQGQFQVVIGPGIVDKVYDEMISITGGQRSSKEDVKKLAGKKQNPLQQAIKVLADIFIPILPAIVTAGLLLGINNILTGPGIFYEGKSLVEVYPAWTDFASIINLIANTAFTFLPALIGWSAVTRFGGSPLLGIVLGLILVHPDLLNANNYATAKLEGTVPVWDLFGWHINKIGYQGQVLPVLVSSYLLSKIEIFLRKRVADSIKLLVVAPVTLLITGFLAFTVIGPITFAIGNAITDGLTYIFDTLPALGGLLYGGFYALLVVTGLHHTFLAVDVQLIGSTGGTYLWPMLALSNIAQGSAALAMLFVLRDQKTKGLAVTSSVSAFLGVTEPAIFGVNIRYKYPFIFGMIGSAIGGILLTINHVLASSIGVGGVPGFLSIFPDQWGVFFIGMAIVLVIPFVLTVLYGKSATRKRQAAGASTEASSAASGQIVTTSPDRKEPVDVLEIHAPISGVAENLDQVPDPAFAEKQMGDGIAIEPSSGKVVAPFDAKVVHVIKSKHAMILEHASGVQVLIHVGIETVSLKGNGFKLHAEIGDEVKAGQLLLEFDMEAIRNAGLPLITPIIIPDGQDIVERVEQAETGKVDAGRHTVLKVHLAS
ncbi:PTS trehalose transporter subunit IIBC [Paenibacillus sp. CAA11]|uniref:PTS system trehalose-specific EIIBC component n=1 Tax=Paenibacillus sp. CAA11 TaxID=1532905 RepID=UPI000D3AD617|nr:PTS system trehalose-specific EIIBC component [Paenibacillus sp. CAA11]AWB44561.1 PTS trehalose transporter subunit IIBC [Paenibacillus sp. CAA11]